MSLRQLRVDPTDEDRNSSPGDSDSSSSGNSSTVFEDARGSSRVLETQDPAQAGAPVPASAAATRAPGPETQELNSLLQQLRNVLDVSRGFSGFVASGSDREDGAVSAASRNRRRRRHKHRRKRRSRFSSSESSSGSESGASAAGHSSSRLRAIRRRVVWGVLRPSSSARAIYDALDASLAGRRVQQRQMGHVLDGAWHKVSGAAFGTMPPPEAVAAGEDPLNLIDVIDGIGAFFRAASPGRVASAWDHVDRRLRPEAIRLPDAAAREAADLVWRMVCQVLDSVRPGASRRTVALALEDIPARCHIAWQHLRRSSAPHRGRTSGPSSSMAASIRRAPRRPALATVLGADLFQRLHQVGINVSSLVYADGNAIAAAPGRPATAAERADPARLGLSPEDVAVVQQAQRRFAR